MKKFRYYQSEADCAIHKELLINNKCIVKMFCGTGKSLLMRKCQSAQGHALLVYVFPSLSLIDQFHTEYLHDLSKTNVLKISSESEATTHPKEIKKFLSKKHKKIICITYQSYETLLENLGDIKINMCIFDEAHHAVGNTYQKLIFENNLCEKQIFFTATPKNTNGIVMYDRNNLDEGMCGALVYDYSYLRGLNDNDDTGKQILNAFEIRVDMYTENINSSVYESIARAILVSGNNRILTFHSDVNTERDTSVNNFVDESSFKNAFMKVLEEFPEKAGVYINFKMIALDASIKMNDRRKILDNFDTTLDSDVYIISSCETIGEGIDTKNANMCVFVDPKTSFVKIIQNLGRVLRPQASCSTILIPCWVNKEKYIDCEEDREKCDAVIRSDISEGGNFNGILNVMSALKQEDEDIYDICLHYPDTYSPQEITSNLEKHGYNVMEQVCDGSLLENIEYLLDTEIDYEECDTDEELIIRVAEKHNICIEIYTHSLENPVETYNSECKGGKIIRLYKDDVYYPIVKKCGKKKNCDKVKRLDRKNRIRVDVHTNPEVKVLWRLMGDFTKEICSCVLDCEIVKYDPMEVAQGIVSRKNQRPNLIPRQLEIKNRTTPELIHENKDARTLNSWKAAFKGIGKSKCPDEVRDYLDTELPGWRDDLDTKALHYAKDIVSRKNQRPNLIPRMKTHGTTPELIQEAKDGEKISHWKQALKGSKGIRCSDEVRDYLDKELPGWRTETDLDAEAFQRARDIVSRKNQRPNLIPRHIIKGKTPELKQENIDSATIGRWKAALKKNQKSKCPDEVRDYLDKELPGWRTKTDLDTQALHDAQGIVSRKDQRPNLIPRHTTEKTTLELKQEYKDAVKLGNWKAALKGTGKSRCSDEVRDYLDKALPGWRDDLDTQALQDAQGIVSRKDQRPNLIPRHTTEKTTPELKQEGKDAQRLSGWKNTLNRQGKGRCPDEVRDYLDKELPGWRDDLDAEALKFAQGIVSRKDQRPNLIPRHTTEKTTPELKQEGKDAKKLGHWKEALKKNQKSRCSDEVRDYLDKELPGWRDDLDAQALQDAKEIVSRKNQRPNLIPRSIKKEKRTTLELKQEAKDYETLGGWKKATTGKGHRRCSDEVRDYLDKELPGWRTETDLDAEALQFAEEIVSRKNQRPNLIPRMKTHGTTPELIQEAKDGEKISHWKKALKGTGKSRCRCSDEVRDYLDKELPGWRTEKKSMKLNGFKEPPSETPEQKKQRLKTELEILHQRYKTLNSQNLQKEFQGNPELWHTYHSIAETNEQSFPEEAIPRNRIIQELNKIKSKRAHSIVDMGCGKAQIAKHFQNDTKFQFINYDHISENDSVISCDISQIPLEEHTVEICILSLAMWGSNCHDYVREAHRILESGGKLYIIEATRRWSEKDENGNIIPGKEAIKLKKILEETGFQIIKTHIEKFSLFVCIKV